MNIILILYVWFFIFAVYFRQNNTLNNRKQYIFWCIVPLMIFSALRCIDYGLRGGDTINYVESYINIQNYTWSDIWNLFIYNNHTTNSEDGDIGYLFFQKAISYITSSFHLFTFIAQLTFYIPFYYFLKKYTNGIDEILFSFVFYTALVYGHSNTGARQFYALGFGLLTYMLFCEKSYKKAALTLVLGTTIHFSLLLMILPLTLQFLDVNNLRKLHLATFILFPLVMIFPNEIIIFMGNFVGNEKYSKYGTGTITGGTETFIFLLEFLSFFCYIGISAYILNENKKVKQMYAMIPCFTFFGPLIYSNGSMIRISMYMYLYLTALLPIAINNQFGNNYKKCLYLAIFILIMLSLSRDIENPYKFFWTVDPPTTW